MKNLLYLVRIPQSKTASLSFKDFQLPSIHLYPQSYYHELAHILQFKRNEADRWAKTGRLLFSHSKGSVHLTQTTIRPIKSKTLKPFKRELETKIIQYKCLKKTAKLEREFHIVKYKCNKDVRKLFLNLQKKVKKRIIKKRIYFVNNQINNRLKRNSMRSLLA